METKRYRYNDKQGIHQNHSNPQHTPVCFFAFYPRFNLRPVPISTFLPIFILTPLSTRAPTTKHSCAHPSCNTSIHPLPPNARYCSTPKHIRCCTNRYAYWQQYFTPSILTATNSGDATTNSGDATTNSGDATTNSGDATTNSGDATTNSGNATTNSGDATTDDGCFDSRHFCADDCSAGCC
jgi:hypothetical protein